MFVEMYNSESEKYLVRLASNFRLCVFVGVSSLWRLSGLRVPTGLHDL